MAKRLSRRVFLTLTASAVSAVACGELPLVGRPGTPPPGPGDPTPAIPPPTPPPAPVASPTAVLSDAVDGYLAVAPRVLRPRQTETIALSLFQGDRPARGVVAVALLKDGRRVVEGSAQVAGRATLPLALPDLEDGEYQLWVQGRGFEDRAPIRVEDGTIVFVETDKPIYKPGQTAHIRVIAIDAALRPVVAQAIVEVSDAKGIKVFRKTVAVDDFGLAALDLPLSTEPNLGTWKVRGTVGRRSGQVDVRVERYVLPKFEIQVNLPKDWALAGEAIQGTVGAEYSFGKPVKGEAQIVALRYVGTWQEYARVTRAIDGRTSFEIPPVRFGAGSPAGGGLANVQIDVTVREESTGYEEKTSRLVTIAAAPVAIRTIAESGTFKPGLPFGLIVVAETPDKKPVDTAVTLRLTYQDETFKSLPEETYRLTTRNGLATIRLTPPAGAATLSAQASAQDAAATPLTLAAGYSPSGAFIHLEPVSAGPLRVGDTARFKVSATREAKTFYYEVLARGRVVFSDVSDIAEISFTVTPLMAPEARLLIYQILSNAEVAADYLPFKAQGGYPQTVRIEFGGATGGSGGQSPPEVKPGDGVDVRIQTDGLSRVGLAAVDRSVFILAENRLNLQQVFAELERLYQQPQAEIHDVRPPIGGPVPGPIAPGAPPGGFVPGGIVPPPPGGGRPTSLPGAKETFQSAGVVVLSNRTVATGKQLQAPRPVFAAGASPAARAAAPGAPVPTAEQAGNNAPAATDQGLAEVQRVRQFFPETWVWADLTTDASGRTSHRVTAPDSITTWSFRAVALSKENGLGVGEAEIRCFQSFFVQADLPYAAVRGEVFPAQVAVYNYLQSAEEFRIELDQADWFDLMDTAAKTVTVPANSVGSVAFTIRPKLLGVRTLKLTARGRSAADAIVKELIVEPEGVGRELIENLVLTPGAPRTVDLAIPAGAVAGSGRAYLALTGNVLSQTIEGLEGLLKMPFGCGEQNMILFAPNVFVSRYLKETNQLKPEVQAKAEKLMLTGYQRELTYRRGDGSFSAFGDQDKDGSLWLTAFVLKTFAQAKDLIYVDDAVLTSARAWIGRQQKPDGSFEPVGFVHHQELLGGLSGKTALTGFVAIALREAGDPAASAIRYLETQLDRTTDPYGLAITAYALAVAKSGRAGEAKDRLLRLGRDTDEGLTWGDDGPRPADGPAPPPRPGGPAGAPEPPRPGLPQVLPRSAAVETTAYAALALLQQSDPINAGRAIRWLASRRNASGGFGSTQDTIVALQAMATAASTSRSDIDATVSLEAGSFRQDIRIQGDSADVLQVVEVPAGGSVTVRARGKGQVMAQAVRRFNEPAARTGARSAFQIGVSYSTDQVEVNDQITITATARFTPPEPVAAGMVVIDVAVPTGFAPVTESIEAAVKAERRLKRWDVAGRKVILYVEDMQPNDQITIGFQARALYPVRAQPVSSQAYAYYRPDWQGESLGGAVVVGGRSG